METKQILKEELAIAGENLKAKGIILGKEALEETAKEISAMVGRVVVRTEGKGDDFFLMIQPMLDEKIEDINPND